MNCHHIHRVLEAYVDGELSHAESERVSSHMSRCETCAERVEELRVIRQLLRLCAVRHPQSYALRASLMSRGWRQRYRSISRSTAGAVAMACRRRCAAAAMAMSVAFAAAVGVHLHSGAAQDRLSTEVVTAHVRATMSNHAIEVAATDGAQQQSWFLARLHFVPRVAESGGTELRLVGWRRDYVKQRMVAALIYAAGSHSVTIFAWPTHDGERPPAPAGKERGYNLVNWTSAGVFYCAVSDMEESALYRLALQASAAT